MQPENNTRIIVLSKTFAYVAGLSVLSLGSLVLFIGWGNNITALKRILPGLGIMQPNTALGFIFSGLSLWLIVREPIDRFKNYVSACCAASALLVGGVTLGEYLFDWPSGLDRMFFPESASALQAVAPGRMSPNTALGFMMIGLALLMIDRNSKTLHSLAQVFSFAAGFIALLSLTGYVYEAVPLYRVVSFTQMAVHTAGAFALLSFGVVLSRPDRGVMITLTSDEPGGVLLRRLLPAVIVIPLVGGWLRLAGERAGFYGTEFGAAMMVVLTILVFEILIWKNAAAINRMVAERRRAEEVRDQFFNLSLDMVCIAGFDGYFKHLNPAWEKTLGWTTEELCAKPYLEFIHPDDREKTATEAEKNADGGITLIFENRYLCKDGSHRWFQWKALPLQNQGLIFATARDVTDQKDSEAAIQHLNMELASSAARLEAANKELEAFAYSVSHDLRAPLRGIDGFSQALLEDYRDKLDEQGRDYLNRVRVASQKMAQLIDDILSLSRVTRGEMRSETVDLSRLVMAISSEIRDQYPDRRVEFRIAEGVTVRGDERLLRVAMENLVGNAWKFTSRRAEAMIEFGSVSNNGSTAYFIRDNGAGFDMAYAGKLFGAFQRLHAVTEFDGTGIGLATVQRIIHRHGGRVWAEGAVDKGATVYFTFMKQEKEHA